MCGGWWMEGGEETVSPYSEVVGWSGVVVVVVVVEGAVWPT